MRFDDEKELEDMIIDYHKEQGLCLVTGEQIDAMVSQVIIPGYGIIDILGWSIEITHDYILVKITIYELKNVGVVHKDVGQISRYYTALSRYIEKNYDFTIYSSEEYPIEDLGFSLRGIVVGPRYAEGDHCYIVDSMEWLSFYKFSIGQSGVKFSEQSDWFNKSEDLSLLASIDLDNNINSCISTYERLVEEKNFKIPKT